ncbi:MAG: glycoside hydrolase family 3 C-terminal domain-containing protein [Ignavibacteriales bacterium]|nr:glycoside hydrolase family 3 C-terminal domain-containing protein [Ignavibacteriales bacterium]
MKTLSLFFASLFLCSFIVAQHSKRTDIDSKVNALIKQMTLDEKIAQMTQPDYNAIRNTGSDIVKYSFGSILWGGDSEVKDITPQGWSDVYDSLQRLSQKTRLKIPILFGIDAVHGHNNVDGAVIFPHNVGLGATRNPQLVEQVALVTGKEIKATGIHWTFAPCVAVARNERWGRTYESYGEDPELVAQLGVAYVKGIQGASLSDQNSVLACVKHFIGDGGTVNGDDQGETTLDEASLRRLHLPGYVEAMKAGAKSIMVSFNSWNGNKMHGHKYLLTNVLKGELKFDGFLVSDWAAIDQLSGDYKDNIQQSINAGLDLIMIPNGPGQQNSYIDFMRLLKELVKEKKVEMSRIDDAVRRIVKVKFEMGLFENPFVARSRAATVGSQENRSVAREAVRQSLVLLKNEKNALPLSKNAKSILVAGKSADDIGVQCGGWTIIWQGKKGNILSGGTTILQGVKNTVSKETTVKYSVDGSGADSGDVAIVVVGEEPYAEMFGDRDDLTLSSDDHAMVERLKAKGIPVIVVLLSGRPMIVNSTLDKSNAFIAAWLPGTEGQGIADVLFGDYAPTGKLPHSWPKNMQQIPINIGDKNYDPLFPYGYGLTYAADKAMN